MLSILTEKRLHPLGPLPGPAHEAHGLSACARGSHAGRQAGMWFLWYVPSLIDFFLKSSGLAYIFVFLLLI